MYWTSDVRLMSVLSLLSIQTLGQDISQHELTTVSEVRRESNLVDSLNGFGYRLMMKMLEKNETSNVVMSPVGITVLMSMALLGSTGSTYNEIAEMLGYSRDILENRKYHEDFGRMLDAFNDTFTQTMLADAVFVDRSTRLRDPYRDFLSRVYKGEALYADFADGGKARQAINEWVKAQTKGKIENFLVENLPPSTKVVLLNALYYKGQWAKPFLQNYTTNMTFHAPTKRVISDFMLNVDNFHHILSTNDGLDMIALPYNDSVTTMYVLKPRNPKRMSLVQLLKTLDFVKIDNIINRMANEKCFVRFPKMNIKSNINLEETIKQLGSTSMFNPRKANFALMVEGTPEKYNNSAEVDIISKAGEIEPMKLQDFLDKLPNPNIHVDSIIQEVEINIDEYGTEAAAATTAKVARSADLFYADTPFLMFIRNDMTKLVTFSAVIFDPTDNIL